MIVLILILLLCSGSPDRAADNTQMAVNMSAVAHDSTVSGRFTTIDEANAAVMAKANETINLLRSKDDSIHYLSEQISRRADTLRHRLAEINEAQASKNLSYENKAATRRYRRP